MRFTLYLFASVFAGVVGAIVVVASTLTWAAPIVSYIDWALAKPPRVCTSTDSIDGWQPTCRWEHCRPPTKGEQWVKIGEHGEECSAQSGEGT